jgi:hypothetical protein
MHRSLSISVSRFHIGVLVPLHVAFVVKSQAECRKVVPMALQNGALDNFLSACFVGKIQAFESRWLAGSKSEAEHTPSRQCRTLF